jgi:hypothetical protein
VRFDAERARLRLGTHVRALANMPNVHRVAVKQRSLGFATRSGAC